MITRHMHSTKEAVITLTKNCTSELEIIKEFPILELMASNGRKMTFRAYTNPKGKDISSLKAKIVSKEGCDIAQGTSISFGYDINNERAILRLDKSKILPQKDKGYILIKVSGNYKFEQIIKLSWTVYKEPPKITTDWLKIKNKGPIVWSGKVLVSELSLEQPSDIQNNLIWYQMPPELSIVVSGEDSEKFILEPISPESCYSKYNLYFNCQDTIEEPVTKDIILSLCADNKEVVRKETRVEFHPATRFVEPELEFCTDQYMLGSEMTQIATLKLSCDSADKTAIAKVRLAIKCDNDKIIECDEREVEIKSSTSKTVNIKMIRENLKKLPSNDIIVEVVVESCNQYTEVRDFSGDFMLKI